MEEQRKKLITNFVLGLIISILVISIGWTEGERWSHRLCDGAFTTGVLLTGIGLLHHFSNIGLFRVMSYGIKSTVELFLPFVGSHRGEKFDAYRERKEENLKSPKPLIIAGLVYLVLSFLLLAIYYLFPKI